MYRILLRYSYRTVVTGVEQAQCVLLYSIYPVDGIVHKRSTMFIFQGVVTSIHLLC